LKYVAEVIRVAEDVAQDGDLVAFRDAETHRDAPTAFFNRHAIVLTRAKPAHTCHRGGAVPIPISKRC